MSSKMVRSILGKRDSLSSKQSVPLRANSASHSLSYSESLLCEIDIVPFDEFPREGPPAY